MLIVHRKIGERIVVGGGIEITVTQLSARGVRFGVNAPRGVLVLRGEVHDAIVAANAAAMQAGEAGDDMNVNDLAKPPLAIDCREAAGAEKESA